MSGRIEIPFEWHAMREPAHFVTYYGDIYHGFHKAASWLNSVEKPIDRGGSASESSAPSGKI